MHNFNRSMQKHKTYFTFLNCFSCHSYKLAEYLKSVKKVDEAITSGRAGLFFTKIRDGHNWQRLGEGAGRSGLFAFDCIFVPHPSSEWKMMETSSLKFSF